MTARITFHGLTARGMECVGYIGAVCLIEGSGPSLARIGRRLRIHKSAAAKLVDRLVSEGALPSNWRKAKSQHSEIPSTY